MTRNILNYIQWNGKLYRFYKTHYLHFNNQESKKQADNSLNCLKYTAFLYKQIIEISKDPLLADYRP